MGDSNKLAILRLYITTEQANELEKAAYSIGMKPTELASRLVIAGMEAVKRNGNRLTLPLRVELTEQKGKL